MLTQVFFVLPLREIHKSGRFDCPGAGLGESDKSFLRYRWLRAMDWFMLTQGVFYANCRELFVNLFNGEFYEFCEACAG